MSLVPAKTLLAALKAKIGEIKLDADSGDTPLFERVETYGNKRLGQALVDLVIAKDRVCLIVPTGLRRIHEDGGPSVTSKRFLEVDLLIADRAIVRSAQAAVVGDDKTIGTLELAERVETALINIDLTSYGPAIFDDGAQQEITTAEQKQMPGRETWIQTLLIPAGIVIQATG